MIRGKHKYLAELPLSHYTELNRKELFIQQIDQNQVNTKQLCVMWMSGREEFESLGIKALFECFVNQ